MAMTVFFVLNGLGVVFLLYVLASFWKEGHRPRNDDRKYAAEFRERDWTDVAVITHPISSYAQGGLSVIPFPMRGRQAEGKLDRGTASHGVSGFPARRISTR